MTSNLSPRRTIGTWTDTDKSRRASDLPGSMASRKLHVPLDGSWRLVEGDGNESFGTTVVQDIPSSMGSTGPSLSSLTPASQLSPQISQISLSQPVTSSQGSIGAFLSRADEEQVIMRAPFRPSLPPTAQSSRDVGREPDSDPDRTPDPEFYMPCINVDSPRRVSARSSRTIRPTRTEMNYCVWGDNEPGPVSSADRNPESLRGDRWSQQSEFSGSPSTIRRRRPVQRVRNDHDDEQESDPRPHVRDGRAGGKAGIRRTLKEQAVESLPGVVGGVVRWGLGVVGMAFRVAQRPLGVLLAVYLFLGGWIMVQNMVTRSITDSLQPICRIPGTAFLQLPFCSPLLPVSGDSGDGRAAGTEPVTGNVEFEDLMNVQAQFEKVLQRSSEGVSLPLEMKRSETSVRDLRSLVRYSDLPGRDELVVEFDGFIDTARSTAADLQKFNTHVGSAVDAVISINRWTSRFINSLEQSRQDKDGGSAGDGSLDVWLLPAPLDAWTAWLFWPFQSGGGVGGRLLDERLVLDKYVENTALVSERIAALIVEAQAVLRLLTRADDHLAQIYDIVTREGQAVRSHQEVLSALWTLVGGNRRRLGELRTHEALLRQVDAQRRSAVTQVQALVLDLEHIQAELADLRDRVAEPALLRDYGADLELLDDHPDQPAAAGSRLRGVPLSVHIETIGRGVERLEHARRRMRQEENDRIRDVLIRSGLADEKLIEG